MTPKRFAEKTGVENSVLFRELKGQRKLSLDKAMTYAKALGCDPVDTGTAAIVGVDVDGTAVEKTKISFRGGDGGATVDYVVLTHAANKFKDVAAAMEELANGDYYRTSAGIYTFTDLISSGGTKQTKQEIELGIVGCHMVNA